MNTQPWEFAVITDKELIGELRRSIKGSIKKIYSLLPVLKLFVKRLRDERLAGALKKTATSEEDTVFYNAPVIILIASKKKGTWTAINCALAAENMMLAAHSLGLGSCFVGRGDFLRKNKKLLESIGLKKGHSIYATLIFGYTEAIPKNAPERKRDNVICWK